MTTKLFSSLAAGAALIALTSTVYASEPTHAPAKHTLAQSHSPKQPMALSDKQMDKVTAGQATVINSSRSNVKNNSVIQVPTGVGSVTPVTPVTQAMAISMGLIGK